MFAEIPVIDLVKIVLVFIFFYQVLLHVALADG